LQTADKQQTGEQLDKAFRSMRTIRKFKERVHKEFDAGPMLCFVHRYAIRHRGHGHSIDEGAES